MKRTEKITNIAYFEIPLFDGAIENHEIREISGRVADYSKVQDNNTLYLVETPNPFERYIDWHNINNVRKSYTVNDITNWKERLGVAAEAHLQLRDALRDQPAYFGDLFDRLARVCGKPDSELLPDFESWLKGYSSKRQRIDASVEIDYFRDRDKVGALKLHRHLHKFTEYVPRKGRRRGLNKVV